MKLWNSGLATEPAEIVRCVTKEQVVDAVGRARATGTALSVLAGGHDWAGRGVREGGLVIDLSGMNRVAVEGTIAVAGGGATLLDVMTAAATAGQATVAGTVGAVGMAGFALGGGYGPLLGTAGLGADRIEGAQVVLADGRVVTADADHEPDLFWALRGGGGNFGVVTELRLRLVPFTTALAGTIIFPGEQAEEILHGWAAMMPTVPDELGVQVGMMGAPGGGHVVFVNPTWVGEQAEGISWIGRLADLGKALSSQLAPIPMTEPLRAGDALFGADDRAWFVRTRNLPGLTPRAIEALVAAGKAIPSPDGGLNMHHFHGVATRVPPGSTVFGERREHALLEIVAAWRDGDAAPHRSWATDAWAEIAPHALPGGYPNLLGPDDHEQIVQAFGENAARLRQVKETYDPGHVFTAIPLP